MPSPVRLHSSPLTHSNDRCHCHNHPTLHQSTQQSSGHRHITRPHSLHLPHSHSSPFVVPILPHLPLLQPLNPLPVDSAKWSSPPHYPPDTLDFNSAEKRSQPPQPPEQHQPNSHRQRVTHLCTCLIHQPTGQVRSSTSTSTSTTFGLSFTADAYSSPLHLFIHTGGRRTGAGRGGGFHAKEDRLTGDSQNFDPLAGVRSLCTLHVQLTLNDHDSMPPRFGHRPCLCLRSWVHV